jgi:GTP-binding protein YchF
MWIFAEISHTISILDFTDMPLSIGIIGLPNVGKSTLFHSLTARDVDRSNYPFATIDPNVGIVEIPDERVDTLAGLSHSAKKVCATIEFVDIAGLVKGAHTGEGLGNRFLSHIREVDAVVYVLRAFENENVVNTQDEVDPVRDKQILETELALKDLEMITSRLSSLEGEVKGGRKGALEESQALKTAAALLEAGTPLSEHIWSLEEMRILGTYRPLTLKPRLFLLNVQGNRDRVPRPVEFSEAKTVCMDILAESQASEFKREERRDLGLSPEPPLDTLIARAYSLLGLITFFTTGEDETRAWTVKRGSAAPVAAGVIHSDFEKYFIRAEVVAYRDLVEAGSLSEARSRGKMRTEGKEYVVKDGDVLEIKHGA